MVKSIEENPRITLGELKTALFDRFQLEVSKTTISNHLDKLMYTLKTIRFEPELFLMIWWVRCFKTAKIVATL